MSGGQRHSDVHALLARLRTKTYSEDDWLLALEVAQAIPEHRTGCEVYEYSLLPLTDLRPEFVAKMCSCGRGA